MDDKHLDALADHQRRPETQADAFELIATDSAVKAFEALRALYIAQKASNELALVYEQIFEATAWPDFDMDPNHVSANACKIMDWYAEAHRWYFAKSVEERFFEQVRKEAHKLVAKENGEL